MEKETEQNKMALLDGIEPANLRALLSLREKQGSKLIFLNWGSKVFGNPNGTLDTFHRNQLRQYLHIIHPKFKKTEVCAKR